MKNFRLGLTIFAVIIIIGQLTVTDYSNLSWSNNAGSYLGIISMICLIVAMIGSNNYKKKNG
jgi:hypothetical protein